MDESKKNERLQQLTDIQYNVTQKAGTERPFQNEFYDNEAKGIYVDIVSGKPLFHPMTSTMLAVVGRALLSLLMKQKLLNIEI